MSAPDTNMVTQKKRHWPVLLGLVAVGFFAALIFTSNVFNAMDADGPTTGGAVMTDDQN